jgi:hypothetical protein
MDGGGFKQQESCGLNGRILPFKKDLNPNKGANMKNLVHIKRKKVVTDSLTVAEKFEKRHDDVLKKISNVIQDDEEGLLNFAESSHPILGASREKAAGRNFAPSRDGAILCYPIF